MMDQPSRWSCPAVMPSSSAWALNMLVVVAALAAGVLDAACGGQGVRGFVQQGAEDAGGVAAQPFAADHDFGAVVDADVPALRGRDGPSGLLPSVPLARETTAVLGWWCADGLPGVIQHRSTR